MKFRQKPNGIWVVDYEGEDGKRRRVSTGIKTPPQRNAPADVRAAGREIILGVRDPQQGPTNPGQARRPDKRLTMRSLFDMCLATVWHPDNIRSLDTMLSNVKLLNTWLGDEAVEDITYTRLEKLVQDMKAAGSKPATIKRKLAVLSKALKMATMWTDDAGEPLLRAKPPMPKLVVNNLKERIISAEEEDAFFAALEKRRQLEPARPWFKMRVLLWLLFDTGGRVGESINLGPQSLGSRTIPTDDGERTIHYITFPRYRTKSGKPRTLPLAERSVQALGSLMDHLTLDPATNEWRFFGMTENYAGALFRDLRHDVMVEAGLDVSDVTLHTIRHTTLTRLAKGGMDLARLQLWAGHSDPKITAERYLHLIPSDLDAGLDILGAAINTSGGNGHVSRISHVKRLDAEGVRNGAKPGTFSLQ